MPLSSTLPWLGTYLLHSTLLLGGVLLVSRWVRESRAREVLWKAALVGGVVTASIQTSWGGLSLGSLEVPVREAGGGIIALSGGEPAPASRIASSLPVAAPVRAGRSATSGAVSVPRLAWTDLLAAVWLAGALACAVRFASRWRRRSLLLAPRSAVCDAELLATLRRVSERMPRVGLVRLTRSRALGSPVALGLREICVPERVIDEMTPGEKECVLAHELAHLARRDPSWLLLAHVLQCAFFFQPLNAAVRRRLAEDAEYLCDELATRHVAEPVVLARSLERVAGWLEERPALPLGAGMAASPSTLVGRVERILARSRGAGGDEGGERARAAVALGMLALLGALACAGPEVVEREPAPTLAARVVGEHELANLDRAVLSIEVVNEGNRLDPEGSAPWSGTGRWRYDDSRELRYTLAEKELSSLRALEQSLADLHRSTDDLGIAVAARPGIVYEDVKEVLDRVIDAGFTHVDFVGAHDEFVEAYDRELRSADASDQVPSEEIPEEIAEEIEEDPEPIEEDPPLSDAERRRLAEMTEAIARRLELLEEVKEMLASDDDPFVLSLDAEGRMTSLRTPTGGRLEDLRTAARDMHQAPMYDDPLAPVVAHGRLLILAPAGTPFESVKERMAEAAGARIWKIELAATGADDEPRRVWLPRDAGIPEEEIEEEVEDFEEEIEEETGAEREQPAQIAEERQAEPIEVLVRTIDAAGGRIIEFMVGPWRTRDRAQLALRVEALSEEQPGASVTIDARPGVLYGDVLALLAAIDPAGDRQFVFVGPYPVRER